MSLRNRVERMKAVADELSSTHPQETYLEWRRRVDDYIMRYVAYAILERTHELMTAHGTDDVWDLLPDELKDQWLAAEQRYAADHDGAEVPFTLRSINQE